MLCCSCCKERQMLYTQCPWHQASCVDYVCAFKHVNSVRNRVQSVHIWTVNNWALCLSTYHFDGSSYWGERFDFQPKVSFGLLKS